MSAYPSRVERGSKSSTRTSQPSGRAQEDVESGPDTVGLNIDFAQCLEAALARELEDRDSPHCPSSPPTSLPPPPRYFLRPRRTSSSPLASETAAPERGRSNRSSSGLLPRAPLRLLVSLPRPAPRLPMSLLPRLAPPPSMCSLPCPAPPPTLCSSPRPAPPLSMSLLPHPAPPPLLCSSPRPAPPPMSFLSPRPAPPLSSSLPAPSSPSPISPSNTPCLLPSTSSDPDPLPLTRKQLKKRERAKDGKRKRRARNRAEAAAERKREMRENPALPFTDALEYRVRRSISEKYAVEERLECDVDTSTFRAAKGAYIGLRAETSSRAHTLEELKSQGFTVVHWDGRTPKLLVDKSDVAFAILAGRPAGSDWEDTLARLSKALADAHDKLQFGAAQCLPSHPGQCGLNRRGNFRTAAYGISYGGGQPFPQNLHHSAHNEKILQELLQDPAMQRVMAVGNSFFAFYAPKVYEMYCDVLSKLFAHDKGLRRPFSGTIFPAITINFGPEVVTNEHVDFSNIANGLCWILSGGTYNPKLGGHLVLRDLGLVIEFPPGSSVLIPSAVLRHGNVPIQDGEVRTSITQYAAGGLFRWVDYGFRTWDSLRAADCVLADRIEKERAHRWKDARSVFSKSTELATDRAKVFGL